MFGTPGKTYPAVGGFQFVLIDPNIAAYRDATQGSPALGAIDYYGFYIDMTGSGSIKTENAIHDILSYLDVGTGLTLTGTSPDGVFQNFIDFDPGDETVRGRAYADRILPVADRGIPDGFVLAAEKRQQALAIKRVAGLPEL